MPYRFTSRCTPTVTLPDAGARRLLLMMGKSPWTYGLIPQEQLTRTIRTLVLALECQGAPGSQREADPGGDAGDAVRDATASLRQLAWPLIQLMERALANGDDLTWDASAVHRNAAGR